MTVRSELFVAEHASALARADARDAGIEPPRWRAADALELAGSTPLDLEALGEIAARAVQYGSGELGASGGRPRPRVARRAATVLCEVLVELGRAEDADLPSDVATEWASDEDLAVNPARALPLVSAIVALVTAASATGRSVYLWDGTRRPVGRAGLGRRRRAPGSR